MQLELNKIYFGHCLELMPNIADASIDMILCDLPYGTTACKWDMIIPFDKLWEQYERIIKPNGAIVLTASQPFTSALVMSNIKLFKYEWIWEKNAGSNFGSVKYQPMKEHENILVFSKNKTNYYPIREVRADSGFARQKTPIKFNTKTEVYAKSLHNEMSKKIEVDRCPRTVQKFYRERGLHPTQKPVALFEYLIKTYTKEGETVLDNCIGSGTTAVACKQTGRNFIGIEMEQKYFDIATKRINETLL
jgi:site-specific DNA-methyltransferase (adenine-specific)